MKVLCFDIGGTSVKYGVISDGTILEKNHFPSDDENASITDNLIKVTKEIIKRYDDIAGVGISCAGSMNFDEGKMIIPSPNFKNFGEMDLAKLFKDNFNFKIVVDNDVNCFAACECKLGAGKKYKTYLVITVGTGIGGAIVVNNQIWRGNNYNAGEVGRTIMDGVQWEKIASTSALVKSAQKRGMKVNSGEDVFKLYDAGDPVAHIAVTEFYHNLGRGIANLIYIFNPEALIIGGGVSLRPDFGKEINYYADYYLVEGFQDTIDIVPAKYRNDGGMIGAYCNYIDRYGEKK